MSTADNPRRIILLGSTGSIGCSTIEVLEHLQEQGVRHFKVVGLAAGSDATLLAQQAQRLQVDAVALADETRADALTDTSARVFAGPDSATEMIDAVARKGDLVIGAIVGAAGLRPILTAIQRGCDIALANKETLVAAGELVTAAVEAAGGQLLPIDSEHSAIHQCICRQENRNAIRRIVLTGSGGPFRTWPAERIRSASIEQALNHPTWNMGPKITIDSASLMNKALEIIEAHWLFGLAAEQIEVIIHPQSIVHSFVEFTDGSVLAQLSPPDMRLPIQYALTWPQRLEGSSQRVSWSELMSLDFEPVDRTRFPAIDLAYSVIERGGTAGAVVNAANEAAVQQFLEQRISFGEMVDVVAYVAEQLPPRPATSLDTILQHDAEARQLVEQRLAGRGSTPVTSPSL